MARRLFDESKCAIPSLWCGESDTVPTKRDGESYYYRAGSRAECLKKGIGAGTFIERKKDLPSTSIQQIKYVGEVYEKKFQKEGIRDLPQLVKVASGKSAADIETLIKRVVTKKGGGVDERAYNSILLYLYRHGKNNLPECISIKP